MSIFSSILSDAAKVAQSIEQRIMAEVKSELKKLLSNPAQTIADIEKTVNFDLDVVETIAKVSGNAKLVALVDGLKQLVLKGEALTDTLAPLLAQLGGAPDLTPSAPAPAMADLTPPTASRSATITADGEVTVK